MSQLTKVEDISPYEWHKWHVGVYASGKGPQPLGTVDFDELERRAKEKLEKYPGSFMYAGGSAGIWSTYRANRRAFEKFCLIPRMLVDATTRNLEVINSYIPRRAPKRT